LLCHQHHANDGAGRDHPGQPSWDGWLRGSFVGVDPLDPLTFVSVLVVTLLTASVAAAAPAWRASRIDPATAFRHDG
jgi:hypothetical protein